MAHMMRIAAHHLRQPTMQDLFHPDTPAHGPTWEHIAIGDSACVLRGFALHWQHALLTHIADMAQQAPFRHLTTPGGHRMQVAMTNCGDYGWYRDRQGYRDTATDPLSSQPWPAMPPNFWPSRHRRQKPHNCHHLSLTPASSIATALAPG